MGLIKGPQGLYSFRRQKTNYEQRHLNKLFLAGFGLDGQSILTCGFGLLIKNCKGFALDWQSKTTGLHNTLAELL